jgi:deoxyribodipyrimidine photolyase-related protein
MKQKGIFIIFPNTLFENIETIQKEVDAEKVAKIVLLEEPTYFTKFAFHKQKLILHRSTMKYYQDYLQSHFSNIVSYINYDKVDAFWQTLLSKKTSIAIFCYNPIDHDLMQKINSFKSATIYDNLSFMETMQDLQDYKKENDKHTANKYQHAHFYKWNRTRLNLLMDKKKPLFGKWTFDTENRNRFSKNYEEPKLHPTTQNNKDAKKYFTDAKKYVLKHFRNNFGEVEDDTFLHPITHQQAKQLLQEFVANKIDTFGEFQDAVLKDVVIGQHSFLSSALNIGLICAEECVDLLLQKFNRLTTAQKKQKINNYEGFLRQLIGWRSYTRMLYEFHGKEMQEMNFFGHHRKLSKEWYEGTTQIVPIDYLIHKVAKYAYLHHIERLMYVGNWALLTQIDPKEIYEWFMITCIDAYEWVMVANVYGMSQHALDNNKLSMMTKPYFSSTNYLKNMSDFVNTSDANKNWIETWNNLYYYFICNNRSYLKANYSTARQVAHWDRKTEEEKKKIIKFGKTFLM